MNYATKYLGKKVKIKVDRPLGSKHPRHEYIYPINYGFIPGTKAPDGGGVDAYILGVDKPLLEFTGKCIAVIHRLNDDDDKLIIVPKGQTYSDREIMKIVDFQEKYFKSKVVRKKKLS